MLRTSAARSREALMSASDNLSTKCSGFFLRSSSPIRPTRARHLYSVDSTAAFLFASRLPNLLNLSDMVHSEIGAVAMTLTIYTCWLIITAYRDLITEIIPNPIDQNPWAHWRSPMDMMRQG